MSIQSCEPLKPFTDAHFPYLSPTADIKTRLSEIIALVTSVRDNAVLVRDPQAKILFDTTREVLKDLVAAYDLYERRTERAA